MGDYAITLWQPWASAIIRGPKRIENRSWPPPATLIGHRIWIHASKRSDDERERIVRLLWPTMPPELPRGAIIGRARIVGFAILDERGLTLGGEATKFALDDPWWMGPCGWLLDDVQPLATPVPCRGFQRLWKPTAGVRSRAALQISRST